jgi:adenylyltransferase/sulfurtransferase
MPGIEILGLFDDDIYEPRNLRGQLIAPEDVGMPKAEAQARRLRRLNPEMRIDAHVARIEEAPLGALRPAGLTVSCVDSREARQHINRGCLRLGMPWIDVAVEAGGTLVRVSTYLPGEGCCLECHWGAEDYARLAQGYPCQQASPAPATQGNSVTGAIAGALAAMEVAKFVNGRRQELLVDRQLYLDARHHQLDVLRFGANPDCACDHSSWRIETIAASARELTLGDALALAGDQRHSAMRLDGQDFVERLHCLSCAWRSQSMLRLSRRLRASQRTCRHCGGALAATAFDVTEELRADNISRARLARPLHDFGFVDGDVLSLLIPQDQPAHFQIGGQASARPHL